MMKSITSLKFENLLKAIMPADETLPAVRHELEENEMVRLHVEDTDEWVIISTGKFTLLLEGDEPGDMMEIERDLDGSDATAFFLPKGKKHGLRTYSALNYLIIKK